MAFIDRFDFNINSVSEIRKLKHKNTNVGENWPVVYLLNNETDAYVGETVNAVVRTKQHLANPHKANLTIDEIGLLVGFKNRVSFFQAFRRFTGDTPEEYRKKALPKHLIK